MSNYTTRQTWQSLFLINTSSTGLSVFCLVSFFFLSKIPFSCKIYTPMFGNNVCLLSTKSPRNVKSPLVRELKCRDGCQQHSFQTHGRARKPFGFPAVNGNKTPSWNSRSLLWRSSGAITKTWNEVAAAEPSAPPSVLRSVLCQSLMCCVFLLPITEDSEINGAGSSNGGECVHALRFPSACPRTLKKKCFLIARRTPVCTKED